MLLEGLVLTATPEPSILDNVTSAVPSVMNMMVDLVNTVLSNPFFAFLMAVGFVGIGLGIFRRVKNTSQSN